MAPLTFIQWNCRGIYRKINELKNLLEKADTMPDIIALQETHLIPKYTPKINDFQLIRKDRNINGGGVCMFVKNEISFVETDLQVNRPIEAQCIKIQDFFFFNVYVPPNKSVSRPDLLSLRTSIWAGVWLSGL